MTYPVIYAMGSGYLFDMTIAIAKNRWFRELAPKFIIVGIQSQSNPERFNFTMPMLRDDSSIAF